MMKKERERERDESESRATKIIVPGVHISRKKICLKIKIVLCKKIMYKN